MNFLREFAVKLIGSFHSAPLYGAVLRDKDANGIAWLALVCAIPALVVTAKLQYTTVVDGPAAIESIIVQVPVLHFDEGRLVRTEPDGPSVLRIEGEDFMLIDAAIEGIPDDMQGMKGMITRDYFINVESNGRIKAQPLQFAGTRVVTQDDLRRWWGWWKAYGWLAVAPFMFLFVFIGFTLFTLLTSLAGLVLRSAFSVEADYAAVLRVAALAATPMILLDTLNDALSRPVEFGFLPRAAVTLAFLAWGLRAAANEPPAAISA